MDVRTWGPQAWYMLHGLPWRLSCLGSAEPFMWALSNVLPCIHCRQSFRALLRMEPVDARQPITLAEWIWRQHNAVNAKLGKPLYPFEAVLEQPISDQEFNQSWKNFSSFVALNYPLEPSECQRQEYRTFFELLARVSGCPTDGLDSALTDRNALYNWLIATLGLPDDRQLIEATRIQK